MSNDAQLPVFTLAAGPWRAEVFDPRPNPAALGTRYCHGGYVRALWHGDRLLTGRARPAWNPADGEGLPEEFEQAIGQATALDGEEYLRLGAGRLRRRGRGAEDTKQPSTPVAWEVLAVEPARVQMRCTDQVVHGTSTYAYTLTREVRLHAAGLDSHTSLRMQVPWSHAMEWFAHPFFLHRDADRTGFQLPGKPALLAGFSGQDCPMTKGADGLWRLPARESLAAAVNLWGEAGPVILHLDPALGGGRLSLQLDRPLDHLVLYCSPLVASPETKLMRAWRDGEETDWTLSYRWLV